LLINQKGGARWLEDLERGAILRPAFARFFR
jgi:hypothetical protein